MTDSVAASAGDRHGAERKGGYGIEAVLASPARAEAAFDQLGVAGIQPAAISLIGKPETRSTVAAATLPARGIAYGPEGLVTAFASLLSTRQAQGIAIAIPMVIGSFATAWAVSASSNALLTATLATLLGGAIGAGLGALAYLVSRRITARTRDNLPLGRLAVRVRVADQATGRRVSGLLRHCGAASVQAQERTVPVGKPERN